jgi:hypothetical protein
MVPRGGGIAKSNYITDDCGAKLDEVRRGAPQHSGPAPYGSNARGK